MFSLALAATVATVALLLPCAAAQRADWEYPKWAVGRYFSISSDAPLRSVLSESREMINTSKLLQEFVEYIEDAILKSLSQAERTKEVQPLRPCSYEAKPWRSGIDVNFGIRGWPPVDSDCITEFAGVEVSNDQQGPFTVEQIYNAVVDRGHAGQRLAAAAWDAAVGNRTKVTPFLQPDFIVESEYTIAYQTCNLTAMAAARNGQSWFLKFGFTNQPKEQQLPNFQRQSVMEHLRVVDGEFLWPLVKQMYMRNDTEKGIINQFVNDSTTLIASFRGDAGQSHYDGVAIEDNPAIQDALGKSDLWIQQAQDALAPSSIAILVLPLLLAVVPIALIADVGTIVMLLYTFISDILAVVPLAIKGVELIFIGSRVVQSTIIRMTSGGTSVKLGTSGAELWAAQCVTNSHVKAFGIAFVVLAIVFMLVGLAAEFVARRYVRHTQHRHGLQLNTKIMDEEASGSIGAANDLTHALINTGNEEQIGDQFRRRNVGGRDGAGADGVDLDSREARGSTGPL